MFFLLGITALAQYTVGPDDTLRLIAVNHGYSVEELILANPQLEDPNIIWEGMVINLPTPMTRRAILIFTTETMFPTQKLSARQTIP